MTNTVARMSKQELRELIETAVETAVEQKLLELLGDPDEEMEIRKERPFQAPAQKRAVAAGERGQSFTDVVRRLELE